MEPISQKINNLEKSKHYAFSGFHIQNSYLQTAIHQTENKGGFEVPFNRREESKLNCSQFYIPHNGPIKDILSMCEVMADVLTKKQRSYCMSKIRGKNTKPEIILRKALWSIGYRYRIKNKLPGKPDLVYPSLKVAIFVDGCFWHRCPKHYQPPKSRASFWEKKIQENVARDQKNNELLNSDDWMVVRVWEHEIKESLTDTVRNISAILSSRKSNTFQPTTN